jgi:hypothetical protein
MVFTAIDLPAIGALTLPDWQTGRARLAGSCLGCRVLWLHVADPPGRVERVDHLADGPAVPGVPVWLRP